MLLLLPALLALLLPAQAAAAAPGTTASIVPSVVLTPESGQAGTSTTVRATGFPARAKGTLVVGTTSSGMRTDRDGAFTKTVVVPSPAPGAAEVAVRVQAGSTTAGAVFRVLAPATTPPPARTDVLQFGVATPSGLRGSKELDEVTRVAGEAPTVVLAFADFSRELDVTGLEQVSARGAVPVVTWEPWLAGRGVEQPAYSLRRITAGDFDPYLRRWAEGLRSFGKPVMLRFAHEMNGDWYPWSERVNGNSPGDYAAAWRHVHGVVTGAGAHNVSWVWSPNVPYTGSLPLDALYPGSAHVDVVGLDGYNFGTSMSWSTWTSPVQLFSGGLAEARRLGPGKPIMIAETASSELGGSKPAWIRDTLAYLSGQPDVTTFVWFDFDKETDWRISSSTAAAQAFAEALLLRRN